MIFRPSGQSRGYNLTDEGRRATLSIPQLYWKLLTRDPATSLRFAEDGRHE
jgi:hypothetical protein